jgi:NTP pyrophosphatase (non-canonical NTP hydrolase)
MTKFSNSEVTNESNQEILLITQEECAEVIQAISKVFRFGMDDEYNGVTNREHLEEEVGDLLCMIELLVTSDMLDMVAVYKAKAAKLEKLAKWSNIRSTV